MALASSTLYLRKAFAASEEGRSSEGHTEWLEGIAFSGSRYCSERGSKLRAALFPLH